MKRSDEFPDRTAVAIDTDSVTVNTDVFAEADVNVDSDIAVTNTGATVNPDRPVPPY